MNIKKIYAILAEFMSISREIEAVVLVSSEGQPLTEPIGIDNNSVQIVAGTFLYLMQNTAQEFDDQEIESISVGGPDGHVIFTPCQSEVFLLVKAGKNVSIGFLKREINLAVKKLQVELQETPLKVLSSSNSTAPDLRDLTSQTASPSSIRNDRSIKNTSIRYRGLFNN